MYYYLKDDDIIQVGDEWTVDALFGSWRSCGPVSAGHTVKGWDDLYHCELGWKVRRKITTTRLGNQL